MSAIDDQEEARAEAYRAQITVRYANYKAQLEGLNGDPVALATLTDNWTPVVAAIREAHSNGEPEPNTRKNNKHTILDTLGGWKRV